MQMMLAVTSAFTTIPPEGSLDQWLADVQVTIDRFLGDNEALAFLNHLRSALLLMKNLQQSGRNLVAASAILATHTKRYEEMRDSQDRKLLMWQELWETMRDDFEGEN